MPSRPVPPFGALILLASIAMLVVWAWFGAAVTSQSSSGCPYRATSAPATDAPPPPPPGSVSAPAPAAVEAGPDCAFSELLDCRYGGVER